MGLNEQTATVPRADICQTERYTVGNVSANNIVT